MLGLEESQSIDLSEELKEFHVADAQRGERCQVRIERWSQTIKGCVKRIRDLHFIRVPVGNH